MENYSWCEKQPRRNDAFLSGGWLHDGNGIIYMIGRIDSSSRTKSILDADKHG